MLVTFSIVTYILIMSIVTKHDISWHNIPFCHTVSRFQFWEKCHIWQLSALLKHDIQFCDETISWRHNTTLRKDFVILQLYWWLFSSTKHCSWNMVYCVVILQLYFPSYNYQQYKSTYYDCWITLQTVLKIATSNFYCKITLVWLDSSLSVAIISPLFNQRLHRLT